MKYAEPKSELHSKQQQLDAEVCRLVSWMAIFLAGYLLFVAAVLSSTSVSELTVTGLAFIPILVIALGHYRNKLLAQKIWGSVENSMSNTASDASVTGSLHDSATDMQKFDLHQLLQSCVDRIKPLAQAKDIRISIQIHQNIPQYVFGAKAVLREVLNNLLDNAVRFTEDGEIWLNAKKLEQFRGDVLLRFEVIDTGIGMSQDKIAHIFSEDSTEVIKGWPSTLPDVSDRVHSMGGDIGVHSRKSLGSTFWFTAILQKQRADDVNTIRAMQGSTA